MANELLQDPSKWVQALSGGTQNKVAYRVLDWINKSIGGNKPTPGENKQSTKSSDFLSFLKDGVALSKLANYLQPGAVSNINEQPQDKESKISNISKFLNFAKQVGGLGGDQLFKAEDLVSGKGFPQILGSLLSLGTGASQNFGKSGLNINTLLQLASSDAGRKICGCLGGNK